MKLTLLDDDEILLRTLQRRFTAAGHQVQTFTTPPPLAELLAAHGVQLKAETAQWAQRLGLRVTESHSVNIKTVLRGGAGEAAGAGAGSGGVGAGQYSCR